jgi:non-heme chloroperoxidase
MKLNPKYKGRYIEGAGGTQLFVEENGDPTKPAILWLHGLCQSRLAWERQFENEELVSQYHMVRLDLRGHGLSDKPTDPAAYQDGKIWADDIQAVIGTLHLYKPVLAGWSYAGHILCDYVRYCEQDNLGGLIFVDAGTESGRDEVAALFGADFLQLIPGFFSPDYAEWITALQQFVGITTYEELDPQTFYQMVGFGAVTLPATRQGMLMRNLDNRAVMQSITIPSLILHGRDDRVVLPASSDYIALHIPHALRIAYNHCGHSPFLEVSSQFNSDIAVFMQQVHR